jgi:hypothetical protein
MANYIERCLMARLWNGSRKSASFLDICMADRLLDFTKI